jgi:uncharacterized membrane protein YkvA (DUF1232 family)
MKEFALKLINFIKDVSQDSRIPDKDKAILATLLALIISPVDLIPDWIPVLGQMDDMVLICVVLDYLFHVLDTEILLSHYPWDMKSFARLRRVTKVASAFVPRTIKNRIWSYQKIPY